MFFLEDGRPQLYQWDLNRRLRIADPKVTEVHFCNGSDDCALVVKTYTDDTYDGNLYADIPNIILQSDLPIKAYAYINDTYTKECHTFKVVKRNKPSDYVYTETDIMSYDSLAKRIEEMEQGKVPTEAIEKAVDDYFDINPVKVPTNVSEFENDANYISSIPSEYITETELNRKAYATEQYVTDAINNLDIPEQEVDLSNYYTKQETNDLLDDIDVTAGVEITDDGNGNVTITEGSGSPESGGGDVDLSNYYTKDEVNDLIPTDYITAIPEQYVTETELNNKGYLTAHQSLEAYATKQFVNDSVSGLATEDYVHQAVDGANKSASFNSYSDMVNALNAAASNVYRVGQNIMVVTLDVPDLWVSQLVETAQPYSYTSDKDITDALKANGSITIGYYVISQLETQKVDLTDYNTKAQVDTKITNAINGVAQVVTKADNTTINASVNSTVPVLTHVYTTPVESIYIIKTNRTQGYSLQFKTAASCTVGNYDDQTYLGDDCADGVFTPQANTNYEVYCYYNTVSNKTVAMVMNLGA